MSIDYTYNMVGVCTKFGEETSHKVRVRFPCKRVAKRYDINRLFDSCQSWLNRNYDGDWIAIAKFDCEGEFECADNDDIIIAP